MTQRRALALVGPTAAGKSALAHELALAHAPSVELISVDAFGVYKEMDLATAKPTRKERDEVTYHLVDVVEPHEEFTVAAFQCAAREAAASIERRGHRALYVGGTGLYSRAVLDDLDIPGQFLDVRADLERRAETDLEGLYEELLARDPLGASRTEPTNARRIVRALEVLHGTGRPFSSFGPGLSTYPPARVDQIGLDAPVEELDARIEARFLRWMDEGLLDEVRALAARPQGLSRTARQAVGYKELLRHVEQGEDLSSCVRDAITQSRRLARRQRAWFRRDPRVEWFSDPALARRRLEELMSREESFGKD